jgi:hypothetical protein
MKGMTRAATDEQVNQELMLDFLDILKNGSKPKTPTWFARWDRSEAMEGGLATLATIKNVGRHEDGEGRSGASTTASSWSGISDARFGGQPGDFYEILINDARSCRRSWRSTRTPTTRRSGGT